jgi:serine/threonine protein kinase
MAELIASSHVPHVPPLTLERRMTLPIGSNVDEDLFNDINSSFNLYGLMKYKLSSPIDTFTYFESLKKLKDDEKADEIDSMTIVGSMIVHKRKKLDGTFDTKRFSIGGVIGSGTFNVIRSCTSDGKKYIFRYSIINNEVSEFESFYENIKHLILYIYVRKVLGNIKFIPQPYYFGLDYKTNKVIFIMEQAEIDLYEYLRRDEVSVEQANNILFKLYYALYRINTSKQIIFRHGDFKVNNIMLTNNKSVPLIIDFGMSTFELTNESGTKIEYVYYNDYTTKIYKTQPLLNVQHDMMHLLYTVNTYVLSFNNKLFMIKGCILNSNIINLIIQKIKANHSRNPDDTKYINDFGPFYKKFVDLETFLFPNMITMISPEDLARELKIKLGPEPIFPQFEKKYLKYKMKYLQLKKLHYL